MEALSIRGGGQRMYHEGAVCQRDGASQVGDGVLQPGAQHGCLGEVSPALNLHARYWPSDCRIGPLAACGILQAAHHAAINMFEIGAASYLLLQASMQAARVLGVHSVGC